MTNSERVKFELEGIAPLKMDRYHGLPDPKNAEGYKKQAIEKLEILFASFLPASF
jgi:hypothetical protein